VKASLREHDSCRATLETPWQHQLTNAVILYEADKLIFAKQ
jgi:hypothetical protein